MSYKKQKQKTVQNYMNISKLVVAPQACLFCRVQTSSTKDTGKKKYTRDEKISTKTLNYNVFEFTILQLIFI